MNLEIFRTHSVCSRILIEGHNDSLRSCQQNHVICLQSMHEHLVCKNDFWIISHVLFTSGSFAVLDFAQDR